MTTLAARNIGIIGSNNIKRKVELRKFEQCSSYAEEIFLIPQLEEYNKYVDELSFKSVVSLACRDTFLKTGSAVVLNYYGQFMNLEVMQITTKELSNPTETIGIENLVESFKPFSLLQKEESNIITSTPQKNNESATIEKQNYHYIGEDTKIIFRRMKSRTDSHGKENRVKRHLNKIGGLKNELKRIEDSIRSVTNSEFRPYVGILLYGPSGTGKTLIGRSIADIIGDEDIEYVQLNGCDLYSKYSGETEAKLMSALEIKDSNARKIVFIDDFDIICHKPSDNAKSTDQDKRIAIRLRSIGKLLKAAMWNRNYFSGLL